MLAKDIPIGRVGKHHGILLFKTYGEHLFKFWPNNKTATLEAADPGNELWEVELLPPNTTVTFKFDGVSWSRPDDYKSEYD
jgi:hypothetical protein